MASRSNDEFGGQSVQRVDVHEIAVRLPTSHGALVVYTSVAGQSIYADRTDNDEFKRYAAHSVERIVNDQPVNAAFFTSLPAGNYSVAWVMEIDLSKSIPSLPSRPMPSNYREAYVTVFPGAVAEVDWRY